MSLLEYNSIPYTIKVSPRAKRVTLRVEPGLGLVVSIPKRFAKRDVPEVLAAIDHVYARTKAAGKIIGTVTFDPDDFQNQMDKGVRFLGLGADSMVLNQGLQALAQKGPR